MPRYAYTPEQCADAVWVGHRVVEFTEKQCDQCGNERLTHLHKIRLATGALIEVGCVCAAHICNEQEVEIAIAEKEMVRELGHLRQKRKTDEVRLQDRLRREAEEVEVLKAFMASKWKKRGRKYIRAYRDRIVEVFWDMGQGWTCSESNIYFKNSLEGQNWVEAYILQKHQI